MMNKKMFFTLMAVALLVLPTAMTASAAGPGDPDTTITVTDATLECGSTATSQVLATVVNQALDPKEVRGVEVHLTFDPTLLQVVDADGDPGNGVQLAVESGLFDGDLRIGQNLADNAAGTIVFAVAQSNGTPVFNATNKAIATITWECAGECPQEDVASEITVVGNTLMSDPDGYPVTVDCAVNGTITIPACVTTGCIEGYVSPQGRYDFSGVRVWAGAYEAYTDATGYFKLEGVEAGTYDVMAELYGYLDAMASEVEIMPGEECTVLGTTTLWGGDVAPQPDPDNMIDILDVSYIGANFGAAEATADVNGDGVVNILDLTVAAANFGLAGPTPWAE
ncbi:MAG TPA: hypothetical protein EYP49_11635 [Anaerolineae bacterium]|nr:hypothetical protein [Anaerolineae bacterium]